MKYISKNIKLGYGVEAALNTNTGRLGGLWDSEWQEAYSFA